jgi:hypothetical protein
MHIKHLVIHVFLLDKDFAKKLIILALIFLNFFVRKTDFCLRCYCREMSLHKADEL